jgi:hypothetical protein
MNTSNTNSSNTININYACDPEGDHTTSISKCVDSKTKSFDKNDKEGILKFIEECSYVHNLEEVLEIIAHKTSKVNDTSEIFG